MPEIMPYLRRIPRISECWGFQVGHTVNVFVSHGTRDVDPDAKEIPLVGNPPPGMEYYLLGVASPVMMPPPVDTPANVPAGGDSPGRIQ